MPIPLISTISTSFQFRPSRGRRSTKALAHASHIHAIELDPELCSLLAAPEHTSTPKRPVTLNGKGSMYWICQQLPGGAPIMSQQAPITYLRLLLQKLVDRESINLSIYPPYFPILIKLAPPGKAATQPKNPQSQALAPPALLPSSTCRSHSPRPPLSLDGPSREARSLAPL